MQLIRNDLHYNSFVHIFNLLFSFLSFLYSISDILSAEILAKQKIFPILYTKLHCLQFILNFPYNVSFFKQHTLSDGVFECLGIGAAMSLYHKRFQTDKRRTTYFVCIEIFF